MVDQKKAYGFHLGPFRTFSMQFGAVIDVGMLLTSRTWAGAVKWWQDHEISIKSFSLLLSCGLEVREITRSMGQPMDPLAT